VLARVRLQNLRGVNDHTVPIRDLTIVVGANNSGKSTVVEAQALRLTGQKLRISGTESRQVPPYAEGLC
jgi:AAA15 family ATPase/GTPase